MTLDTLNEILSAIPGYAGRVTYWAFPEGAAPGLPFICYLETGTDNFAADGVAYHVIRTVRIELYTAFKEPTAESLVETALSGAGIYWEKLESDHLDDENCWMTVYEIEV